MLLLALLAGCNSSPDPNAPLPGLVSSATPEATAAGIEILEAGGNAIDAAVAVSLALGVSEPAGSGIGGQVIMLVQAPGKDPYVILGTSRAPLKLPAKVTDRDIVGRRATTVPSALRTLDLAHRRFGSGRLSWSQLVQPARRVAEQGFTLGHFRHASTARYARALQDPMVRSVFLTAAGTTPARNARIKRPRLAKTLERLATAGANDFYQGQIATTIAADMQAHGGWITLDDLKSLPEPKVVPALHSTYRGYDVYSLPPPAGGWVVLLALNILEQAPPEDLTQFSTNRPIWVAEALREAHRHRLHSPVQDLVEYEKIIRDCTSKKHAEEIVRRLKLDSGETTHFCVVDSDGMAVSVSQSLNAYFGAKVMAGDLGFFYNDYMREFELDNAAHPFSLKPAGLPYSSMSATILTKNGVPRLVLGSPGSRRIISAVVQVISHWVDSKLPVDGATAMRRLHVVPEDDDLHFETRPHQRNVVRDLEKRGFSISIPLSSLFRGNLNPYFGGVHALALEADGSWNGAADPRRDGKVGRTSQR